MRQKQKATKAKEGKGSELAEKLLRASKMMQTAKGCHLYLVSQEEGNADHVCVTEVWDSQEDHDQSLKIEGVGALISEAMPLIAEPPTSGQKLIVLGGI